MRRRILEPNSCKGVLLAKFIRMVLLAKLYKDIPKDLVCPGLPSFDQKPDFEKYTGLNLD